MKNILLLCIASALVFASCCHPKEDNIEKRVSDTGLLRNDDLEAVKTADGKFSIIVAKTGAVKIKDIELDWTFESPHDSLAVFCSNDKRGYYNVYTGEIAIPAQYRRAWVFSEGLAAVQKNGMVGFINHSGDTVIDFKYPFHGNPLSSFVFQNGRCVVADSLGKCGVIDKRGKWLIKPEYDNISDFKEYAIVSKEGLKMQIAYDGTILNSFVLDEIERLTYAIKEKCVDKKGRVEYIEVNRSTGMFSYRVGGRCGLMDANCHRLTEPLYHEIIAVDMNMFRAILPDYSSEVILNAKGEVMK